MRGWSDGVCRFSGAGKHRWHRTGPADDWNHAAICEPRRFQFDYQLCNVGNADGFFSSQRTRQTDCRQISGQRVLLPSSWRQSNEPAEKTHAVEVQSVTDRGLNERRPLNEDSFLADSERFIFAVADGVGGAEAGEVASQTAIEVLDEAFRHQADGDDVEDLMELAIQRANASIHQMAQEHAKFSMMATTIVALHLNGNIATIGHVGDSRLYRLTLRETSYRETEDHSIVEEEVRAGRMTPNRRRTIPART